MAKTIQYKVDINTSRAEEELQDLNNQLDDIQEKSKVDLLIDNANAVKSVGQLRTAYRQLRDAQLEVGEGTEEFTKLGAAAAGLKDRLDAVNEVSKDLGGSTLERFRNSLGRIREGIVNLDLDKVRQGFGQLRTTFTALTTGISTARLAVIGFTTALAASGIGLIIIALTTLLSQFDDLSKAGGLVGKVFTGINNIVDGFKNTVLNLADAWGLVDKNQSKAAQSARDAAFENAKARKELLDFIEEGILDELYNDPNASERTKFTNKLELERIEANKRYKERIDKLLKDGQISYDVAAELEIKNIRKNLEIKEAAIAEFDKKIAEDSLKVKIDELDRLERIELDALNRRLLEGLDTEKTAAIKKEDIEQATLVKKLELYDQYGKDITNIQLALSNNLVKLEQQRIQELTDFVNQALSQTIEVEVAPFTTEEKRPEDVRNANEKIDVLQKELGVIQQINSSLLEGGDLEIENLTQSLLFNSQKLDVLEEYNLTDSQLYKDAINEKIILESQLTKAIEDENKKRLEDSVASEQEILRVKLDTAQQSLQAAGNFTAALQNLSNVVYENELANAQGNAVEEEKIRKKSFEANKALSIVGAVIGTAQAVINGFNAGVSVGGPAGVVLGPVMAALAGVTGAIQIATIASQTYSPTSTSATAPATNVPTPSIPANAGPNVSFAGGTAGFNQVGQGSQSMAINASISVSEINSVQQNVAVFESGSLIGQG
jgi:hypothetical protein